MRFNKIFLLILFFVLIISFVSVNAADLNSSNVDDSINVINHENLSDSISTSSKNSNSYYVDCKDGDDSNDGLSWNNSLKTFSKAVTLSEDDDEIYLSDGVYSGLENTKLTLDKSVNIIGSQNTTFDGLNNNYLFLISDNTKITFKNIKFINAYKTQLESELVDDYDIDGIYGAALDIKNADVTLENCSFVYNMVNYIRDEFQPLYGGAISNLGNLIISDSYFYGNAIWPSFDIWGYGGAIYNKGYLIINNSLILDSDGVVHTLGGSLYNDGVMLLNNITISDSYCGEESKGSAIFNNGNLTLLNSIIENNTIERTNFNYIYGNIFNSGKLIAVGNIFRNNSAIYKESNSQYFGTPTIYSIGELNVSYNSFIDNVGFNGIYTDIFLNSGSSVNLDDNWWQTNDNPYENYHVNYDKINSWIVLDLNPDYTSININDSINIIASWKLSTGESLKINLPLFEIIFLTNIGGKEISSKQIFNQTSSFIFNNTKNKGTYELKAYVNSFSITSNIDVGKLNTTIDIVPDKSEFYFNESLFVEIYLKENKLNLTDKVYVRLNENTYKIINIKDGIGNITFNNLTPGNYTLKVNYNGDDNYAKSENNISFIVKKIPVYLKINPIEDIKANERVNLTISLSGYNVKGMADLYVNGEFKQLIYLNNGNTTFNLNYFPEGRYNITVVSSENSYYLQASDSVLFNVEKVHVSINISAKDIYAGDRQVITIEVCDNFNSNAILSLNDVNYTILLNDKINNITFSYLTNGTYDVKVIFEGNDRFIKTNASASFNVYKKVSALNVSIQKTNLTGKIMVKTNSEKCSGEIGLYINQKYYTAGLVSGAADFDVEFDNGTNYIYVFYSGDFSFESSSWNTTLGNASNFFIIGENITYFQYNDFNYTVCLYEENGIAVPNQVISIKIDEKNYNITTNNKGEANLLLNLNEGYYLINAIYKNTTINNTITIKPVIFNATVNNLSYGDNEKILVEFDGNLSGKVKFEFSNQTFISDIVNSTAACDLSKIASGNYSVDIYYFNDYFNSSKINKHFIINKADIKFDIIFNNDESDLNGNITIRFLNSNVTGKVECIIDNNHYFGKINDSNVIFNFTGLNGGYHNLSVKYYGDENYNQFIHNTSFPVKYLNTDLQFIINETSYGEKLYITVKVNQTAKGNITFHINGQNYISEINNGSAICEISGLNAGKYNVTADFNSNSLFKNQLNKTSFEISKANSTLEPFVNEIYLDENIKIYVKLSPNATGTVSFSIDDYYSPRNKTISNSLSHWLISPLKTGQYNVRIKYNGDDNYYSANSTFVLNVSQVRSLLTVTADDITSRDNAVFKITLKSGDGKNINGNVVINFKTINYTILIRNGKSSFNVGKLTPGEYSFSAFYEGNSQFSNASYNSSFTVADYLLKSNLTCNNVVKYYNKDVKVIITLTNSKNKAISGETIYVTINGVEKSYITDFEGKVYLNVTNKIGKYKVYAKFNGSDSYYPSDANGTVEVLSTVEAKDIVKLYNTNIQYFALFHNLDGQALSNTEVTFKIANKLHKYTTLPNGIVRLNINLKPGIYNITAINPVTCETKTTRLYIYLPLMENRDITNYYGANSIYKVRVIDSEGKAVGNGYTVTFNVNGKTYNQKTNKYGYAQISVKLKAKTYVITAQFNKTKVYNKIIVKPVLKFKITSNKKTKKTKFKAKLINKKGKPLKSKKILFKIKDKKYKVKTNKKGIAILKLKLKLKKGKYKVYAKYKKSKVSHVIKIK